LLEGLSRFGISSLQHPTPSTRSEPALPLPDKPSIAVLPFTNIGGDPEQAYFSDGLAEDIIAELAKLSGLFVIARNSVFTHKGKADCYAGMAQILIPLFPSPLQ
jgi:TolB-like protein